MKLQQWQDLEAGIDGYLKVRQRTDKLAYQRFYDTKSAGNLMPAMPADFLIGYGGRALFLEAKFSEKYKSLRSCFANNVDGNQTASARIWGRAKIGYVFLFYSKPAKKAEVWNGQYCALCRSQKLVLDSAESWNYASVEEAIDGTLDILLSQPELL